MYTHTHPVQSSSGLTALSPLFSISTGDTFWEIMSQLRGFGFWLSARDDECMEFRQSSVTRFINTCMVFLWF